MAAGGKLKLRDALPIWWRVARQWFTGTDRWQARWYVLACSILACSTTWLAVHISYTQKHFSTALAEKNQADWKAAVWEFVIIILIAAPLKALEVYMEKRLVAVWRAALSQAFITAYTTNCSYFHMQLARGTEGSEAQLAGQQGNQQHTVADLSGTVAHSHAEEVAARGDVQSPVSRDAVVVSSSKALGLQLAELSRTQQQQQQQHQAVEALKSMNDGTAVDRALLSTPSKPLYSSTPVAGLSLASAVVDNPDQRITADVANFVKTSVGLVLLLGKKVLNCAAFAGVLWSISPKLVVFLVCYAFMGTFGTAWIFGRPLTSLQQKILKLEADLRFGLVRLRENAEAIAFYGGDEREAAGLSQRLAAMLAVLLRRIMWLGGYELWVNAYSYATILLPSLVLAPEYFQGKIPFGTLTQASYAFSTLEAALGLILARLDDFSSLAAETARLDGLLNALAAADVDAGGNGIVRGFEPTSPRLSSAAAVLGLAGRKGALGWKRKPLSKAMATDDGGFSDSEVEESVKLLVTTDSNKAGNTPTRRTGGSTTAAEQNGGSSSGMTMESNSSEGTVGCAGRPSKVLRLFDGSSAGFSIEDLNAWVPGRHHEPTCVCADLSFSLAPGESLLVMGPSGCGKSSLLRVIAGLWTVGSGTIRGPATHRIFFLPQKPFMPLGSLRQQLLFPAMLTEGKTFPALAATSGTTAELGAALDDSRNGSTNCVLQSRYSHDERPDAYAAHAGPSSSTCIDISSISSIAGTDQRLQQLLQAVSLGHLLVRFDAGLDAEVDWAAVLSLGEQQRVALCRLLLHQPQLAFLDEATAALDPKTEAVVYGLVRQACSSYVSVGHRMQLLDWHSHVLVSQKQGCWRKYAVTEYKQRVAAGLEG